MSRPEPAPLSLLDRPRDSVREDPRAVRRRAVAIWPRLDPAALRRAGEDVDRLASIVERRTALPRESIIAMLLAARLSDDDVATWFG